MRALALAVVATSAACSTLAPSTTDASTLDGNALAPELEIMYRSRDGLAVACQPLAEVPLTLPPQGGLVLLVGMRAKNLGSNVMVTASLRDTVDNQLLSVEQRPVELVTTSGGWAEPGEPSSLVNWANLPACPMTTATRDLHGQPYLLRIAVEDGGGKMAEAKLTIVPTCDPGPDGDLCRCQCAQGYVLGDPCPP